jgi:hypothetical protein
LLRFFPDPVPESMRVKFSNHAGSVVFSLVVVPQTWWVKRRMAQAYPQFLRGVFLEQKCSEWYG